MKIEFQIKCLFGLGTYTLLLKIVRPEDMGGCSSYRWESGPSEKLKKKLTNRFLLRVFEHDSVLANDVQYNSLTFSTPTNAAQLPGPGIARKNPHVYPFYFLKFL